MNELKKSTGPILVPGVWLSNIAVGLRLSGVEWRIVSLVLAAPRPFTTRRIAKSLKLEYTHAKRAVRSLIAWKILQRSPAGLVFSPDYHLWESPAS
jgi:predicted transcriptional regulator